jgi:RP/EB family microtubule-associated protein
VKARYQDNLEFCQWLKRYFDLNYNGEPYDAVTRRKGQDLFYIAGGNKIAGPPNKGAAAQPGKAVTMPKSSSQSAGAKPAAKSSINTGAKSSVGGGSAQATALQGQLNEMKMNMETLEKERDFYFGKLRDIEMLIQAKTEEGVANPTCDLILKILYASEEEKIVIDEAGNVEVTPLNAAEPANEEMKD